MNYDQLNLSELIGLCHKKGIPRAHLGIKRLGLIGLLDGSFEYDDYAADPLDVDRKSMMEFLTEFPAYREQMTCTMHCWVCPSGRTMSCAKLNCEEDLMNKVRKGIRPGGD